MKRPVRGSGSAGSESQTKLSGNPGSTPSAAALQELQRILKRPPSFHLLSESIDGGTFRTGSRAAIAAGNLRDEAELMRLQSIVSAIAVSAIAASQKDAFILVVGRDADKPLRTASASRVRRSLEDLGAVFVERPADADTPEALAAFLEREYAPDAAAMAAALDPIAPIAVLTDHDITAYLQPRPNADGDQYFLSDGRHNPRKS